jgi:hypothetical protein
VCLYQRGVVLLTDGTMHESTILLEAFVALFSSYPSL